MKYCSEQDGNILKKQQKKETVSRFQTMTVRIGKKNVPQDTARTGIIKRSLQRAANLYLKFFLCNNYLKYFMPLV